MRAVFITQGKSLGLFHRVAGAMNVHVQVERLGWFVADKAAVSAVEKQGVQLGSDVIREWEVVASAIARPELAKRASSIERKLKIPTLWPSVIADRRIFDGQLCKVRQAYASPFSDVQMASIAVATHDALEILFEKVRPDVVVSFAPNTVGAMLAASIAKAKGIVHLTLKSTKISNLVTLSTEYTDQHPHIAQAFGVMAREGAGAPQSREFASSYLQAAQTAGATYEGVWRPPKPTSFTRAIFDFAVRAPRALGSDLKHTDFDPQRPPKLRTLFETTIGRTFRANAASRVVSASGKGVFLPIDDPFVFFPLNSEPEIALSVYSINYRNQIEVARNVAQALPMGTVLVVKDHPRSWGVRSPGYYRHLLEIPNVRLVPVSTPARALIDAASLVVALSSFVGFEAVLAGKPVVTLGSCIYDMLAPPRVWKIDGPARLPTTIQTALSAPKPQSNRDLQDFVSAVHQCSIPLDLYSTLLRKGGRDRGTSAASVSTGAQCDSLARHILERWTSESIAVREQTTTGIEHA